ncbi:response regulator [Brevundimonas sp.]|uniref:response regulator n=1 Tax=Brevundimonas sp. TaxID=1871086 RepID=UPI0025F5E6C7|nr:response regulator [Brevundimonas sp.]
METAPPAPAKVLVVDDDPGIRDLLIDYLARQGFDARGAADGREMDQALARDPADVVVLDLMMPGEDGLSICRRLAEDGPPVIMLSAMGEDTDRIVGLELGAADYLPKPCNPRELLARIRAVLRRSAERRPRGGGQAVRFGAWRLDLVRRELMNASGAVSPLSSGEFHLLRAFVERPGRVLTRDQLMDLARGPTAETFDRAIDVQISRLRKKLDDGTGRELIETVRGEGYRLSVEVRPA